MKKVVSLILALGLVCFGENQKEQKDSCVITCSKCVVNIWAGDIDKYKQSFEDEEDFYITVDDTLWYMAQAEKYIESKGIPTKYIKADHCPTTLSYEGQNVNIVPDEGIFSFILFTSGKKPLVVNRGFADYDIWMDDYFEIKDSQTSKTD